MAAREASAAGGLSDEEITRELRIRLLSDDGTEFDLANLATTVTKKGPLGDGLVHVGRIDATGHDLGTVSVTGDLGQIDAGSGTDGTPAVKSLTVRSMGRSWQIRHPSSRSSARGASAS